MYFLSLSDHEIFKQEIIYIGFYFWQIKHLKILIKKQFFKYKLLKLPYFKKYLKSAQMSYSETLRSNQGLF